ncbi:exodeoxyribonuclease V subunit beta [Thalassotalea nanhaiensis]|uniref:RecBCD enzyme subunit RecB n=1 Tax=Thalassotalea nanhaiensis TaxID=3065648 RepID=A0ABY9TN63_9GAMM|nr:exodeoxyribonuclease V subunit beta [Colwelliaceae bacterium SQ345]
MNNVNSISKQTSQALHAETLPLNGCHLIEASAGTGKTFNITRIYLRMLLERRLSVENILVMTFTKAATEEIRGRIDEFLRDVLTHWQTYTNDENNHYFYTLKQNLMVDGISDDAVKVIIKNALINLDEASIFTIHGFCKRVLSEQAFASGMNFNAQMEADDSEVVLQACQDHYRILAHADSLDDYQLFVQHWATPEAFLASFKGLLYDDNLPTISDKQSLVSSLQVLATVAEQELLEFEQCIFQALIDSKKGKARDTRVAEFEQLLQFLKQLQSTNSDIENQLSNAPDFKFIAANRFSKSPVKAELKQAFKTTGELSKLIKGFGAALLKSEAYSLAVVAVKAIKFKVLEAKRLKNMLNFDDLISELARALKNEQNSNEQPLTNALIEQYPVALIDEFQDTDPKQFSILTQLYFDHSKDDSGAIKQTALYLIGDPKQAIYGFRGGDIFTYLSAGELVDQQWVMDTNWRSSAMMIEGYNHLFYGNELTSSAKDVFGFGIQYQPVQASINADKERLIDNKDHKALQFVDFKASEEFEYRGYIKTDFRKSMAHWVAAEVGRLLSEALLATTVGSEPVKAADIAILVRDGGEAEDIKQALNTLNIASVYKSQRANLFLSDIAQQFVAVLNAIINHEDDRAFIQALSGPYFSYSPSKLYEVQNDEIVWERVRSEFNRLKAIWFKRGFMAMALKILHDYYPGSQQDNERQLTNIIHLFELLQTESQRLKQPQELMAYLTEQCQNPNQNEAELRLESDADLIQIVTQHGSKGLEYPVVFVPFASRHKNPVKFGASFKEVLRFHQQEGDFTVHLGDDALARQRMADEGYAEDVRLLYVAVTRAKHRCYLACTTFQEHDKSPLGKALQLSNGQSFSEGIQPLIAYAPQAIGLTIAEGADFKGSLVETVTQLEQFTEQEFTGRIERDWWLSSFSALTRNVRHGGRNEPDRDPDEVSLNQLVSKKDVIRFAFQKGAKTGNLLHDVFERIDFEQPNWQKDASYNLTKFGELPSGFEQSDVYDWLEDCLNTPYNEHNHTLAQLSVEETLREAEFYFPMENVDLGGLKRLLTQFRKSLGLPEEELAQINSELPAFGQLKGMMHGFIDLIFCKDNKYFVCDYKSSHLGDKFSDYLPERLSINVIKNFYDLQFLIYSLALHRYLKRRVPNYSIETHFGGVYYLYLRGMSADNNDFCGVFFNSLTAELLQKLDHLFSGTKISLEVDTKEFSNE